MIALAGLILGALWGGLLARRRKGNRMDIAQYAAGYGILFGLIATFLMVLLTRMG